MSSSSFGMQMPGARTECSSLAMITRCSRCPRHGLTLGSQMYSYRYRLRRSAFRVQDLLDLLEIMEGMRGKHV
jgi:hypothetical protein